MVWQSAEQVLPAGVPAGKAVPSHLSVPLMKPSPHFGMRVWQVASQAAVLAGSQSSAGGSTMLLPQCDTQFEGQVRGVRAMSQVSSGSITPLPQFAFLQDTNVVRSL